MSATLLRPSAILDNERISRSRVALIDRAVAARRLQYPPIELLHLFNSRAWSDALWEDGRLGLSTADTLQVLIGIGWLCPTHHTEYAGDDVAGLVCTLCEFGLPAGVAR
jgi:hypothetical protein